MPGCIEDTTTLYFAIAYTDSSKGKRQKILPLRYFVVENLGRFEGNEQQFRNWLYKIATNAVNNHLRKTARRSVLLKAAREQANSQVVDRQRPAEPSAENLARLKQAMFELKPRYQTIITLRFFENLKLTEIAEVLASNPGTIRSQLARALAKLRKKITVARQEVQKND